MRNPFPLTAAGLLLAATAAADVPLVPSWLVADPAAQNAELDLVAAYNDNNELWNVNGHHGGSATVLLPTGWTVEVLFHNEEDDVPHSVVVIPDPGDEDSFPTETEAAAAAFPGAHSASPVEGTEKGAGETFAFRADTPGDYLWYCGVPGHGMAGMWIRLRVTDNAEAPSVILAADAAPGRE